MNNDLNNYMKNINTLMKLKNKYFFIKKTQMCEEYIFYVLMDSVKNNTMELFNIKNINNEIYLVYNNALNKTNIFLKNKNKKIHSHELNYYCNNSVKFNDFNEFKIIFSDLLKIYKII